MTDQNQKSPTGQPIQFWIYMTDFEPRHLRATTLPISFNDDRRVFHVIEYSAYKSAIEKCAELEKENKQLKYKVALQTLEPKELYAENDAYANEVVKLKTNSGDDK